jgi:RNA polymerase sigma-70 factor (ECF subfamily)
MLSTAQTRDKTFDVSLASALHNFVVAPARWASQGIHRRVRKKRSGSTGEKHRKSKQAYLSENVIAAILNSQGARLATPSTHNSIKNTRSIEGGGEMQEMILSGYIDGVFGYAMALTRNAAEAADLVQETYVRALKAKESLRPSSNVKSWLFTILRNIWLNRLRHARTTPQIVELEAHEGIADVAIETSQDAHARYVSKMEQEKVRNAIQQLPEEFREIIILREYEELSYQEIAAMLDCPAGTVMSRLARARSRLRLLLSANEQSFQGTERWKVKRYSQET